MHLHDNLRALMAEQDLSAAELSRRAGVGGTAVIDILNGKSRSPKLEAVEKIARALGVEALDLILPREGQRDRKALLAAFERLPPEEQTRLALMAQAWASLPRAK